MHFIPFKSTMQPELFINTQSVPCSKHCVSVLKTSRLMLYRSKVAVISEMHMKHKNERCGHHVELFNVTHDGTGRGR